MIMMNDSFVAIPTHFPSDLKLSSIHAFPPIYLKLHGKGETSLSANLILIHLIQEEANKNN